MDDCQFDQIARQTFRSRRSVLGTLAGLALAGTGLGTALGQEVDPAGCKKKGDKCKQNGDCCNNLTCKNSKCEKKNDSCKKQGDKCKQNNDCCNNLKCKNDKCKN